MENPMVSICMITYNHEPFIRQAIEGVLMQQTAFPYHLVIGEDCSTDQTRTICEDYAAAHPDRILLLPTAKNLGMVPNFKRTLEACTGKYTALCEGDDYWTDPLKLQRQVDFLEKDAEFGLVHTNFEYVNATSETTAPPSEVYRTMEKRVSNGYIWHHYLNKPGFIITASCVFRTSLIMGGRNLPECIFDHWVFMEVARQSKVHFFREKTCAYRLNPQGAILSDSNTIHKLYYQVLNDQLTRFYHTSPKNAPLPYQVPMVHLAIIGACIRVFKNLPVNNLKYRFNLISILFKNIHYIPQFIKKSLRNQTIRL
jgi:glycosyltransferase involved in cell wall biosynthesis